jgi:Fic family protein
MQTLEDYQLDKETLDRLSGFDEDIKQFREGGPLDPVAAKKLHEYFRVLHIFHSTGIEGNRLSLQETEAILLEGIEIGGKPLADQLEVKDLDAAYDFLLELSKSQTPIREIDIREMHRLVVRNNKDSNPGSYRQIGVVISGSEHRPPEPVAVPGLMQKLIESLNEPVKYSPVVSAAYVHHQLAGIHPFVDGNGRLARLLMNLILLRYGYPIVNISRQDRPKYYETLSFADVGLYSPLTELVLDRASEVFSEMKRVREETERMRVFAERWGQTEAAVIQRREEREYKQWLARMELVRLAFDSAADLLDEKLKEIGVDCWPYQAPDFSKYVELREKGNAPHCWFFRIRMQNKRTSIEENFVFSFFRDWSVYPKRKVIPLQSNRTDDDGVYRRIETPRIRLREILVDEEGRINVRVQLPDGGYAVSSRISPEMAAQEFFDDVLKVCFGLHQ